METAISEDLQVQPQIGLVNRYANKARHVAIRSIQPLYFQEDATDHKLRGFLLSIEGPPKHISYFRRLLDEAHLKMG